MKENIIKTIIATAFAGFIVYLGEMVVPLIFLFVVIIADYITGMAGAWINKEISSKRGFRGIIKKLCYFLVVVVGMVIDYAIICGMEVAGIETAPQAYYIALVLTIWLIINELISILENLAKIGVPLPDFLMKLLERLKLTIEKRPPD